MRPNFKIKKSKSLPAFRQKIYKKINTNPSHQQWRLFLQKQFDLFPTIRQLSKAQFDITNQNHNKISVRQNFKIKKQIIRCLEDEQIQQALIRLHKLKDKLAAINQEKNVLQMIMYIQCRQFAKEKLKGGQEDFVIEYIKDKVSPFLAQNHILLAKIKTMTILSILLLRFHGILMTIEERNLLIRTIQLKKKKMLQLDVKTQRQTQFQCLLYLLLELYKILYLLKSDQQTIQNYYNQLHAYSQLFINKNNPHNCCLNIPELNKILDNMKPVLNDLNIYQDSNIRKQLAFLHIKEQIIEKEEQKHYRRSIENKRSSQMSVASSINQGSSNKLLSKTKLKQIEDKIQKKVVKRLVLRKQTKQTKTDIKSLNKISNQIQIINQITNKGIHFNFILPLKQRFFIIQFYLDFRNGFSIIDLKLVIRSWTFFPEIFIIKGIKNYLQSMNFDNLYKLIQKICFKIFGENGLFSQIHNLIYDDKHIPQQYAGIEAGLMRVKAVIKQYLRKNYQEEYLMGKKFIFKKISAQQLSTTLENDSKDTQQKKLRSTFTKRKAILHRDDPPPILSDTMFIKCIIKHQMPSSCLYFIFNIYYTQYFKGLDVHHFKPYDDQPDLSHFVNKLKNIAKTTFEEHKLIRKERVVQQILRQQHKEQRVGFTDKEYKVDQELQLTQTIKTTQVSVKIFNKMKNKQGTKSKTKKLPLQVIKTGTNQYDLFTKKQQGKYITYSNQKFILHIPLKLTLNAMKFQKKRLRMYNCIKLRCLTQEGMRSIKTSRKKNSIVTTQQQIVLTFVRHCIVRNRKGYLIVLQYQCPRGQFLYEIVANPSARYFCILKQKIKSLNTSSIDINNNIFQGKQMNIYKGGRKPISQANYYYLSNFN